MDYHVHAQLVYLVGSKFNMQARHPVGFLLRPAPARRRAAAAGGGRIEGSSRAEQKQEQSRAVPTEGHRTSGGISDP